MPRLSFGFVLLLVLVGCRTVYSTSAPHFYGTFLGYYMTEPTATPVGVRLDVRLGEVTLKRYTFSGTAILGDARYTVEGYEETDSERTYLEPQAAPPPTSDLVAELKNSDGTLAYTLCTTYLMSERFNGPHVYSLYEAGAPRDSTCRFEAPFATVTLGR